MRRNDEFYEGHGRVGNEEPERDCIMGRDWGDEWVEIEGCEVVAETDAALLILFEPAHVRDDGKHWVPKSQINDESELRANHIGGERGTLIVKRWLAEARGLV